MPQSKHHLCFDGLSLFVTVIQVFCIDVVVVAVAVSVGAGLSTSAVLG